MLSLSSNNCFTFYNTCPSFPVVSIAFSYIDRVLSQNRCKDRRSFKLLSASSLHLAIKVHYPHRLREVGGIIPDLSRGEITLGDIIGMEEVLTHSLTWLVNPCTPQGIVNHVLALLNPGGDAAAALSEISDKAHYLAELSVYEYYFVATRNSIVSIAALLNASESVGYFHFETSNEYRNDWHTDIENLLLAIGYNIDWNEMSSTRDEPGQRVVSPNLSPVLHETSSRNVMNDYPSPTSHEMQWCSDTSFDDTSTHTKSRRRLN